MKSNSLLASLLLLSLSIQTLADNDFVYDNQEEAFDYFDDPLYYQDPFSTVVFQDESSNNFNQDYADVIENTDGTDTDFADSYVPVMTLLYYGHWSSSADSEIPQFSYFSENSGYAEFTANDEGSDGLDDGINFWIYDGPYKDQKGALVQFVYNNATDFTPDTSTFANSNISFQVTLFDNGAKQQVMNCTGSYELVFTDSYTEQPYQADLNDYENAVAQFSLTSQDCNIAIYANVAVDDSSDEASAMEYTIMVTLICVGHLYACIQMIRKISLNEADGARYSLQTFSIFTGWDVFLCLFHFYGALTTEVYFHYFITPAFWYFILASILEARLLLLIWKAKYYQTFQSVQDLRQGLTWFYAEFYGFLAIFLVSCYFILPETWFFYLTSFFFVPQIVHNAIRGQKYKFDACYIFLLGVIRILIPLYVKAYSGSMFRYTPSGSFAIFYVGIVVSQVLFLYLQSKMGSRFFVPSYFLPPVHNYFIKVPNNKSVEEMDVCSICMDGLDHEPCDLNTELLSHEKPQKYLKIMQTPCKHNFHEKCLKEWMEIKLECPFCRSNLPALE